MGGTSQNVTVSLVAGSVTSYSGNLTISGPGETQTLTISAGAEALPVVTSTQVLTVTGSVSGVTDGQVKVTILDSGGTTSLMQQQTAVEDSRYRLILLDLQSVQTGIAQ